METISPAALDEIPQKDYLKVRKQDSTDYDPDSLKVMQLALERYLSNKKIPYSLIIMFYSAHTEVYIWF